MKRIVIAGSRNFSDYNIAADFICRCVAEVASGHTVVILSGGCRGADKLGERYALENKYEIEYHPAEWKQYGKRAGVVRNRKMAEAADLVICFWDGKSKGTKNMIEFADRFNKVVKIFMIE